MKSPALLLIEKLRLLGPPLVEIRFGALQKTIQERLQFGLLIFPMERRPSRPLVPLEAEQRDELPTCINFALLRRCLFLALPFDGFVRFLAARLEPVFDEFFHAKAELVILGLLKGGN